MPSDTTAKFYKLTFAALVAGSLIFHATVLWESRKEMAAGYGDFIIFYTGAQIVNDGRAKELFNIETQNAYQAKFDVPQLEWPLPFNHAPYELLIFLPLARLSYPAAHAIWSGINLLLLFAMLGWLVRYIDSPHRFFICAAVLAWFPTMEAFRQGQDSILSAGLLLAVFIALKRGSDGWAGFFLALGLYKPQLVLPMAGVFLAARRWQAVGVFVAAGVVLTAVSLAMVGWQGAFDLVTILTRMKEYLFIVDPGKMPNLRGLLHVLSRASESAFPLGVISGLISLSLYALCLYFWWQNRNVDDSGLDLKVSLAVVTTVLTSYHLYSHDLFPLLLPLMLLFRYVNSDTRSHPITGRLFFLLLIVLFLPVVPRYLIESRLFGWGALAILALYMVATAEVVQRGIFRVSASR